MESIEATLHSSELSPETLSAFFDALKPGGRLGVFVKGGGEQDSSSAMIQKEVSKRLTLEGFEDVVVSEQTSVSGTRATKVSGRKPKWERGVTFSLGEKKTKKTLVSKASAWEVRRRRPRRNFDRRGRVAHGKGQSETNRGRRRRFGMSADEETVQRLHLRKERGRGDEGKRNSSELCREDGCRERPERRGAV